MPSSPVPATYGTNLVDRINLSMHLRRYVKLVAKRWLILFICTALGLGYSLYKVSKIVTTFRAQSEIEVTRKLQVSQVGAVVLDPMETFWLDQQRLLGGQTLQTRVQRIIRGGTTPMMEPPGTAYSAVRGQGSSFQLSVTSPDAAYARVYASNWAKAFLEYKKENAKQLVDKKKAQSLQDLFRQEKTLEKARERTEAYRKENQIGSASDTYKAAQIELDQLKSQLGSLQTQRRLLEQTSKEDIASGALGEKRPEAPAARSADPGQPELAADPLAKFTEGNTYVLLRAQLNEKLTLQSGLTNTLRPKHPFMVGLSREVEGLNQKITFQLQLIEDKRKARVQSLGSTEEGLVLRIQDLTKQVQDLRGIQDEFERLKREEAGIEAGVTSLKDTLRQIDLSAPDEDQFTIVGEVLVMAVNPQKSRLVLQGAAVGFLIGLALAYLLHRLDDRLEMAEDIEAELEQPVLGQVPQVDMRSVKEGFLLVTRLHRHNMFAESIRGVRSAIMLGAHQGRKQVIVVSSAVPGDGKTTFTVNFAATLAAAGNRVLLIDADLRRGNVHNYFQHPREPGLSEILMGDIHWSDVVQGTELKTLSMVACGKIPAHPGELLVNPVMMQFIEEARQEFDYVVLDCPPLTAIDDTFSIIGLVDGLVFVVRAGQTSMRFAKTALAAVKQRGATVLGIVLNGITADNPYYYYNYYYHSYYNRHDTPKAEEDTRTARKMASPKGPKLAQKSIMGEAMAISGQAASSHAIEKESLSKAELFRARRAAKVPRGLPGTVENHERLGMSAAGSGASHEPPEA